MVQDYPDGFNRSIMGGTVEPSADFFIPWCQYTEKQIAAGANSTYTINFNDPNYIYFVDVINVTPKANTPFYIIVKVNDVIYAVSSETGSIVLPFRTNPSVNFINGDKIDVTVYNTDSSTRTFLIILNGTKVVRPLTFGIPPDAYFTFSPSFGYVPFDVLFTDVSSNSPTNWAWSLDGINVFSTSQNPVTSITSRGVYSPSLQVFNEFGSDVYTAVDSLIAAERIPLSGFSVYYYYGTISFSGDKITCTNISRDSMNYAIRDYGANYFDGFDLVINFKITKVEAGTAIILFALTQVNDNFPLGSGYGMGIRFFCNTYPNVVLAPAYYTAGSQTVSDSFSISLNIDYTMRITHTAGSTSTTFSLYAGNDLSNLIGSKVLTHSIIANKFRYLYLCSSWFDNNDHPGSFESSCRGIISL